MAAKPRITAASSLARPSAPVPPFDALVAALARGDAIDVELAEAVCRAEGRTMAELNDAVRRRAAELRA